MSKAVLAGHDDGDPIYVGRARMESDVYPCKIVPNKKLAFMTYNGRVRTITKFEVISFMYSIINFEIISLKLYYFRSIVKTHLQLHGPRVRMVVFQIMQSLLVELTMKMCMLDEK